MLLWQVPQTTPEESRIALVLLGMLAGAEMDVVRTNIDGVGLHGPGTRERKMTFFWHVTRVRKLDNPEWSPMMEQALNVIYFLAEHPETIAENLIKKIAACLLDKTTQDNVDREEGEETQDKENDSAESNTNTRCSNSPTRATLAPQAIIRANTIVAVGDLTFRFPNLIEPWTSHLYARLRDESGHVRKNTLMVLTHLILNDMVKVKGQISEMATCLEDKDSRISDLAKLFFLELSRRATPSTTFFLM
ncbi:meiotic chromosome condensation [Desmophyllum pertusum]|uniref:Meiotic chromosome condensation n=1 Tax=Desmophyllum pertusum TaxID=174260 RepID=A0A9W9ZDW0_9CNID|nr:meiotic chromosome condensation [Desmophyllum pertusum]